MRSELHLLSSVVDFDAQVLRAADITSYLRVSRSGARIRPALLSNPMARTNWRSVGHRQLIQLMPNELACIETPSVATLDGALKYLLFNQHSNVLVLNGGDGTIHHVLNALIRVTEKAALVVGHAVPTPRILFVNGGGMNMLARTFQSRGHPLRTLKRFLDRARGAHIGTLATKDVPLFRVSEPDGTSRLGYIFGSEIVFNALTLYERFGQGYRGLGRFIVELGRGYAFRTALWQRYEHLLDAPTTPLVVDGMRYDTYLAVVATTVPLQLAKGLVTAIGRMASPGGMNTLALLETDKGRVIQRIPGLMFGRTVDGADYRDNAKEMRLYGPYTLDGERFDRRGSNEPVSVSGTEHVIRGIWLA